MIETRVAFPALALVGMVVLSGPTLSDSPAATPVALATPAQSEPGDKVALRGGFVCRKDGTETQLQVETFSGSLRTLSFQAISNLDARIPSRSRGRKVGRLALASGPSERPKYDLRMPKRARGREVRLLNKNGIRVVVRPGKRNLLTVFGLPRGTDFASIELKGAGLDVLHAVPGSERVVYGLTTYRHDASTTKQTSSQTC